MAWHVWNQSASKEKQMTCHMLHNDDIEEEFGYLMVVSMNKGNGKYYDCNDVYSDEKEMYKR